MNLSALRVYLKFLSRHKVYTFVSVAGFAISLTFVVILSVFAGTQLSMDNFHANRERIYVLGRGESWVHANPLGDYVMGICPEVETYTRAVSERTSIGAGPNEGQPGSILMADRDFFNIFSFSLIEGDKDEVLAGNRSAVLSQSTARKLFPGGEAVGRTVWVATEELTVTGVMEDFPYNTHFVAPDMVASYNLLELFYGGEWVWEWYNAGFDLYFLAKENADFTAKRDLLLQKFNEDYWIYKNGFAKDLSFIPLEDIYYADRRSTSAHTKKGSLNITFLYIGLAILILVIALLNYINMTVAQAGFRGKEAAVRKLMGSSRARVIMQMLGESLLMAAFALLMSLILAFLSEPFFNRLLSTELHLSHAFNAGTVPIVAAALVLVALGAGIIPALGVSSFRPVDVIKGTIGRKVKAGYSKVLIIFQFTVCTVLLVCTFVMGRQARFMAEADMGFNRENILVMWYGLENREQMNGLKDRLMQVPGVESVGVSAGNPLDGGNNWSVTFAGQSVSVQILQGDSAFVDIFGLKLEDGPLTNAQITDGGNMVYLNEMARNAMQPDPVTGRFDTDNFHWNNMVHVGTLGDLSIRSLHTPPEPVAFSYYPDNWAPWDIVVKIVSDNIYEDAEKVRAVYSDFIGGKYYDWYFADDRIYSWYENERRMTGIMGTFTILSILIMVMGVFAMSLYMIRQKEKEIGLRKVSGATVGEILVMLNLQSLVRVLIAFVIACPVAYYAMSKWLRTFAYRIDITPGAFILAGIIVTALCLASVSWQTFRAARANPVDSLKSE